MLLILVVDKHIMPAFMKLQWLLIEQRIKIINAFQEITSSKEYVKFLSQKLSDWLQFCIPIGHSPHGSLHFLIIHKHMSLCLSTSVFSLTSFSHSASLLCCSGLLLILFWKVVASSTAGVF